MKLHVTDNPERGALCAGIDRAVDEAATAIAAFWDRALGHLGLHVRPDVSGVTLAETLLSLVAGSVGVFARDAVVARGLQAVLLSAIDGGDHKTVAEALDSAVIPVRAPIGE